MSDDVRYNWAELIADKPAPPPQAARPVANGHSGNGYAAAALNREAEAVATAIEGTRNDALNRAAFNLAQLVASGHLDATTVRDHLTDAALHAGLDAREIDATLKSGHRAGSQHPRAVPELAPQVVEVGVLRPPAPPTDDTPEGVQARTSWWPEPIVQRAAQAAEEPDPTHLVRDDGKPLMYSGKVNGLIGESESGKSWVALLAVVQALSAGQRVLILDFEDSPGSVHKRLQALGCTAGQLELVHYANPDEALQTLQANDLGEALANRYAVIVADGVNVAMTLLGYDLNSNTDASLFRSRLLQPLARTGACVITIDHVPKNPDSRGKGGIGAQAKRALQDGTCLLVEIVEPFGKGQSGILKLTVDKDRNGAVRGISGGGKYAGKARIESVSDQVRIHIEAPDLRSIDEREQWRPTGLMERVSRYLEQASKPLSGRDITDAVSGKAQHVRQATVQLVSDGFVRSEDGPHRSTLYVSERPFREQDFDPSEPSASSASPVRPSASGTQTNSVRPVPLPLRGGDALKSGPANTENTSVRPDLLHGHSDCNRCGESTPDDIIEETAGYCRPCGRVMNP